jgi:pyruvate,water dikinase
MLRLDEFPAFIDDPAVWTKEITKRREYHAALAELEPPFPTDGLPSPPSTWRHRTVEDLEPAVVGEVIQGIGSCSGTATGRARIVVGPASVADLEPGEILVCPATDPSWTPLFLAAAAVVVDVGAPLSHASIVSRELGIPCVVSARHASRRIRDGATVTVDGTHGVVRVESP